MPKDFGFLLRTGYHVVNMPDILVVPEPLLVFMMHTNLQLPSWLRSRLVCLAAVPVHTATPVACASSYLPRNPAAACSGPPVPIVGQDRRSCWSIRYLGWFTYSPLPIQLLCSGLPVPHAGHATFHFSLPAPPTNPTALPSAQAAAATHVSL